MPGDVSDPSDWLKTHLASLSALDSALRCQVCKEFYDTPMITSCSHTFCSLCIRRCFSNDGKCPTCRTEDQSSKLRRNWTVQESVDGFLQSRQQILDLAVRRPESDDNPKRKRRKVNGHSQDSETAGESLPRRSTRNRQKVVSASQNVIVVDEDDIDDAEYRPDKAQDPRPISPIEVEDGLVACPMCRKRMKEEFVFGHLDRCDGQDVKKKTPPPPPMPDRRSHASEIKQPSTPSKHLPHLNYSLLKDNALKKRLQELGIPTWGTRQLHMRRHTQWVDIFNANSDSVRPKSNRELLRELDIWERTQGGHSQAQNGPTGVMRKDFDGDEWTGRHKNQFDDLIAQARAKRAAKAQMDSSAPVTSDAMEDVTSSTQASHPSDLPSIAGTHDISKRKDLPEESATPTPAVVQSSPIASMLHSAAQDVRRRSSVSSTPVTLSNTGKAQPTSDGSPASSHTQTPISSQTPLANQSQEARQTSHPVNARMASPSRSVQNVSMFQVPEKPINDCEDFGSSIGGG